ncbi:type II toxin-antitoxin system RelE/ParE family toxin [Janthinobacterium sp. NKUCC08_JDC]|uniref:type II toxin-antitoxin system RelE/ParE family toxin n=1 Tax=Janthinobacterium sp. NKUCC08_JDC TaxID=2842122 RepID=UPI001C5BBE74|nr:type II toxin-antitoxin system RelE/ParE family toxin [Janthinobacterium sp. NKUCC08_JDC]MBW3502259.1 type II toxin-antitoxin system RelE/ParE family toxin [Janthinobacterium sp. NKUCC08_JDC]
MLPIQWKVEAQEDLTAILTYIAQHNRPAALQLYHDIDNAMSRLPCHPHLYRSGRVSGTRELVAHPNYVVVYRVEASAIEILAVMHTRQLYP